MIPNNPENQAALANIRAILPQSRLNRTRVLWIWVIACIISDGEGGDGQPPMTPYANIGLRTESPNRGSVDHWDLHWGDQLQKSCKYKKKILRIIYWNCGGFPNARDHSKKSGNTTSSHGFSSRHGSFFRGKYELENGPT
jgi:hypothetical protein